MLPGNLTVDDIVGDLALHDKVELVVAVGVILPYFSAMLLGVVPWNESNVQLLLYLALATVFGDTFFDVLEAIR